MLMTPVGDHGVQRAATGRSEGGEEPQSLGQHVTDMGKPAGVETKHCISVNRVRSPCVALKKAFVLNKAGRGSHQCRVTSFLVYFRTWGQGRGSW